MEREEQQYVLCRICYGDHYSADCPSRPKSEAAPYGILCDPTHCDDCAEQVGKAEDALNSVSKDAPPEEDKPALCIHCGQIFREHYTLGRQMVCYNTDPNKMAIIQGTCFTPPVENPLPIAPPEEFEQWWGTYRPTFDTYYGGEDEHKKTARSAWQAGRAALSGAARDGDAYALAFNEGVEAGAAAFEYTWQDWIGAAARIRREKLPIIAALSGEKEEK
jgi:hypothetical protein